MEISMVDWIIYSSISGQCQWCLGLDRKIQSNMQDPKQIFFFLEWKIVNSHQYEFYISIKISSWCPSIPFKK